MKTANELTAAELIAKLNQIADEIAWGDADEAIVQIEAMVDDLKQSQE
jgi:hypothetical protein